MLRIEVLGHFAAFVDGAPLNLAPMSTSVRLWHYLLLRGPGPRRRLHVARELWPEEEDTRGLATLRRHLHVLLRGLPPAEDDKPWLILDRSTLRWNIDSDFTLDVAEYEALLAGIEAASPTQGPGAAMASLEQAAALYAGDLLPESYDDWVLSERERLRQLQCEALFRLVGLQASRGRPRRAIATASRLVGHDPLFEEGHRLLMGLQYLAGDRGAALHAYRQGEAVLAQELGVEPLPATVRLAAAVQGGEAPGQIFALLAADLPRGVEVADLVPGRVVHNLPARESRFVGRRNDLEAVGRMLREHRLTTLTGPAGCGKTRLALELASGLVAADVDPAGRPEAPGEVGAGPFPDGIWWVDLAAVAQADQVAPAVATVLGASTATGAWSPDAIARTVAGKTLLLVLDNCEHIIAACAAMAHGLLRSGPGVRILATSRELLGVVGEAAWVVPPLYCPPAGEGAPPPMASAHEGLLLFEDRARRVRPAFRIGGDNAVVVAQVCRRLDGLPLAIELAAAQMRSHTLAQLADGLPGARDPPARGDKGDDRRHGTLAAAIDWSHDLLSAPEQGFLRRLAVFRGGCSLEAAAAVCTGAEGAARGADEILSGLVDKSLVAAGVSGGEGRFRLLDTMRRYAAERLAEAGEEEAVRHRHAAYFLALAEAIAPRLLGHGQLEGLDRLEADHANLQAALAWHARPGGDAAAARRLAVALWRFWILHSHFQVGGQWLGRLAPAARGLASPVE
ncbi:MAG: BTAD domain-containing putative transcriptional regulator, partial [Anaerolineae bacterium]